MVCYILRTLYNLVFFDMMILLWEAVTSLLVAQINFVTFKHKIRHYARLAIFWLYSVQCFRLRLKQCHCVWAIANLITISEELWKTDEILFQNVYGHRESVVLGVQVMLITYCFCDFLFHGYPCMTKENVML